MLNIKHRVLSGLLTLVMVLSLVPMMSFTNDTVVYADSQLSNVKLYAENDAVGNGLTKIVENQVQNWNFEIWHYSGNYWGNNTCKIYDSDFEKTEGGTADLGVALTLGMQTFTYPVQSGSDLEKAIKEGKEIVINISSGDNNIPLKTLYDIQTQENEQTGKKEYKTNADGTLLSSDATAQVVQDGGKYYIKINVKPKLNYYREDELSYTKTFGLNLRKWIPFVKNGYGYQVYSMWRNGKNVGAARGWVNQSNPHSLDGQPAGTIHPSQIMNNIGQLDRGLVVDVDYQNGKFGNETISSSNDVRIGWNTFRDAGAVGMRFIYPVALDIYVNQGVKVVASYAKFIGIDENGVPLYEQIGESEIPEYVEITEEGYVEIPEEIGIYIPEDETWYKGILNDVVNSTKDLGEPKDVHWGNNITPQTYTDKVELNSTDILQYDFGRYTSAVRHILSIVKNDENSINTNDPFVAWFDLSVKKWAGDFGFTENWTAWSDEELDAFMLKLYSSDYQRFEEMWSVILDWDGNIYVPGAEKLNGSNTVNPADINVEDYDAQNKKSGNELEESYTVSNKKKGNFLEESYTTSNKYSGSSSAANVIYIRYLLFPTSFQFNKVNIIKNGSLIDTWLIQDELTFTQDLGHKGTVKFNNIYEELIELIPSCEKIEFKKWVASEVVIEDITASPLPSGSKSGTTIPSEVVDFLKTEHLYAEWDVTLPPIPIPSVSNVPEWRLSLYNSDISKLSGASEWNQALFSMKLNSDSGCKAGSSYITNSGKYNYKIYNPNGKETINSDTPENQKYDKWLHSKALTKGSYTVNHSRPMAAVFMSGTATLIKSTDDSGLTAASWVESSGTQQGLLKYDIKSGKTPNSHSLSNSIYMKSAELFYKIRNIDTYTHYRARRYHWYCSGEHCSGHCGCYLTPESTTPEYEDAKYLVKANFDRYIQSSSRPALTVSPTVKNDNGYTTIKYQQDKTLNIYPEYGMLFDNDSNVESIKWMVSDQSRLVKPVIYQTLDYKVYVDSASTGTMATDSRAKTKAGSLGLGNLPVLYKGAPVNSTFKVYRDSNLNKAGIMTVKTFALDIDTNKVSYNDWGNNSYNGATLGEHNKLLSKIDTVGKATVTEKLLIDSPGYGSLDYTGGVRTSASNAYTKVDYSSQSNKVKDSNGKYTVCELKHKLIVRGGQVIGVEFQNRNTLGYTKYTMSQLKTADAALYDALVGMNLYNPSNDRSQTVLSTFEHKAGDSLTEDTYATMLASARQSVDGIATPSNATVSTGSGWYSEDSTVLVVKEYITNYTVPSIAVSDKISLQVNGLQTPVDKNQFFSAMGKGYLYLKYDLPISTPAGNANAYFEFTTISGDGLDSYGKQGVNYLVPNVSVSDTTRAN